MPQLTHEQIRTLVRDHFQTCLNRTDITVDDIQNDPSLSVDEEAAGADEILSRLRSLAKTGKSDPATEVAVEEALAAVDARPPDLSLEQLALLRKMVLRTRIEETRIIGAKLRGHYEDTAPIDPLFAGMDVNGFPPVPGDTEAPASRAPTLRALADRYIEAKSASEWVPKTKQDNCRVLDLICELLGGKRPITSLGTPEIRTVRDALTKLPSNYMKTNALRDAPLSDALSAGGSPLSAKTQVKYLQNFRAFLNWCVAEEYLSAMPGPNIKLAGPSKGSPQGARRPFDQDQLARLFSSPLYTGHRSESRRSEAGDMVIRDGKYWIPLIALYSGMRLGEIVQLLKSDLKAQGGITYFDIARAEGEEKQLKTASSVRQVPVHPVLQELGFLDYVAGKPLGKRIFDDIEPGKDGYFSHNYSKWFGRYLTVTGIRKPKTAFHSFRHNFKDALTSGGVPEPVSKALMGHSDGSVHATYGSRPPLANLSEGIQKVCYEIDLMALNPADS